MSIKVQRLVGNVSPFSGISFVNKMFDNSGLSNLIDNELGKRVSHVGFSYSDIIKNLACVFLAGGSYIEDINTHFGEYLSTIPGNNVSGADTILRGLDELKTKNTKYVSDAGKSSNFNSNSERNI